MEQFGRADPERAKAEIQYWQGHDGRIFARLKLWAAASDLTTGAEAARILTDLPDDIFGGPRPPGCTPCPSRELAKAGGQGAAELSNAC